MTYIHPNQRYGIIFGGNFKGMMMDIDQLMYQAVSKNNDSNELKGFIQSQGPRESANEHLVPEQLFDDPNTKEKEAEGISAVKALQIASKEGQTIYTINQDNYSQILPKLNHSSDVMRDVANAVNAGKEVTISERQIRAFGWSGTGFIVLDPYTGYGAYLIDGGKNGGFVGLDTIGGIGLMFTALTFMVNPVMGYAQAAGIAFIMAACLMLIASQILYDQHDDIYASILCNYAIALITIGIGLVFFPTAKLAGSVGLSTITGFVAATVGTVGCISGRG